MDELRNYNKEDNMTTDRRKSLKRYVEDENMSVDRLRKVSQDDGSATWYYCYAYTRLVANYLSKYYLDVIANSSNSLTPVEHIVVSYVVVTETPTRQSTTMSSMLMLSKSSSMLMLFVKHEGKAHVTSARNIHAPLSFPALLPGIAGGGGNVHVGSCDGSIRQYLRTSQAEDGHSQGVAHWHIPSITIR